MILECINLHRHAAIAYNKEAMKIPGVGPDVEQAVDHFFGLTFLHNWYPIMLVVVLLGVTAYALYKPQRSRILFMLSAAFLLLHFEYVKHFMDYLLNQSQVTLTTEDPNYRFIWITDKLATRIIPFGLLISGIGTLLGGIYLFIKENPHLIRKKD